MIFFQESCIIITAWSAEYCFSQGPQSGKMGSQFDIQIINSNVKEKLIYSSDDFER